MITYDDSGWAEIGSVGATVTLSATLANRLRLWTLQALMAEYAAHLSVPPPVVGTRFPRFAVARARKIVALLREVDAVSALLAPHGLGADEDAIVTWARGYVNEHASQLAAL